MAHSTKAHIDTHTHYVNTHSHLYTHAYVAAWPIHKSALKAAAAENEENTETDKDRDKNKDNLCQGGWWKVEGRRLA